MSSDELNSFRFEMAKLRVRQVRRRNPRVSKSRASRMVVRSSKGRVSRLLEVGRCCREGIGRKGKRVKLCKEKRELFIFFGWTERICSISRDFV